MHGMHYGLKSCIQAMQARYRDPLLTVLTLLLLVLLFVVAPLEAAGILAFQAFGFIIALVMIGGVLVLSASPISFSVLLVAFFMNLAAVILRIRGHSNFDVYLVASAWLILAVTLGWVVARAVFAPGSVNYHRIVGAVLLYLLIGVTFVSLFVFVGLLVPKSYAGIAVDDSNALASSLIYFSFVTLTSTGYGDVLPLHPVARSLCNLESIIGQLYPATLLARLVTLELNSRQ
jgi:Ion channel